jgi:hypothetical protein
MHAPQQFPVVEPFKHQSPEKVREIAQRYGFRCETAQGTHEAEIWTKITGGGYWVIRIDSQGHGRWAHGRRPHYHKNWVEISKLPHYLKQYLPEAYVYDDNGALLGQSKDIVHPESKSKAQHIPR